MKNIQTTKKILYAVTDIKQLSPDGEVNSTETRSVEVYIHRSSPTLRGIVVLVFTKSDG